PRELDVIRRGLRILIRDLLNPWRAKEPPGGRLIDALYGWIDFVLGQQLDEILHHPAFRALERAWRSIELVIERVHALDDVELSILHVTREELLVDCDEPNPRERGLTQMLMRSTDERFGLLVGDIDL